MARRPTTGKARPSPAEPKAPAPSPSTQGKTSSSIESPRALKLRIDELERELAAARSLIGDLQSRQSQIADRIAWALDSLHELMEEGS